MKFHSIVCILITFLLSNAFSGLLRIKEKKVKNENYKLTLLESDKEDKKFGKIDIWQGINDKDSIKVYHIKDSLTPPAGFKFQSTVGILITEKFYFLFPWETCVTDDQLLFSKLTGLLELAHGTNDLILFTLNPFLPKGKHVWKLHHTAPFGSISVGSTDHSMLNTRLYSTSIIDLTGDIAKSTHALWDLDESNDFPEDRKKGVHTDGKFKESRKKYITGTNKPENNNKIMDLVLAKFDTGKKFKTEHLPNMLQATRLCTTIGLVITRNRIKKIVGKFTYLSNLLEDIDKYGFPTNLAISSCRYRIPEKDWSERWNEGPKTYFALGEQDDKFASWYSGKPSGVKVEFTE